MQLGQNIFSYNILIEITLATYNIYCSESTHVHITAQQAGRSRVRFQMESLELFIDLILPAVLRRWGRLSL
jgi:hypothetical protein